MNDIVQRKYEKHDSESVNRESYLVQKSLILGKQRHSNYASSQLIFVVEFLGKIDSCLMKREQMFLSDRRADKKSLNHYATKNPFSKKHRF